MYACVILGFALCIQTACTLRPRSLTEIEAHIRRLFFFLHIEKLRVKTQTQVALEATYRKLWAVF